MLLAESIKIFTELIVFSETNGVIQLIGKITKSMQGEIRICGKFEYISIYFNESFHYHIVLKLRGHN